MKSPDVSDSHRPLPAASRYNRDIRALLIFEVPLSPELDTIYLQLSHSVGQCKKIS